MTTRGRDGRLDRVLRLIEALFGEGVAVFLCGPGASFVTGADILVDGGYIHMGHDRADERINYTKD